MTPSEQCRKVTEFFQEAVILLHVKSKEYSPEGVAMIDVFYTAADLNIEPEQVLWMHLRKHLAVLRNWIHGGLLTSDLPTGRMLDAVNYIGMIYALSEDKPSVLHAVADANESARVDETDRESLREWLRHRYNITAPSAQLPLDIQVNDAL